MDYKKAYDMIPHSWISESLELVSEIILEFIRKSVKKYNTELTSSGV